MVFLDQAFGALWFFTIAIGSYGSYRFIKRL